MNIQPIGFVDPSALAATLFLKRHTHFGDDTRRQSYAGSPHHDTEVIALRGPRDPDGSNWFDDVEQVDYPLFEEWKAAQVAVSEIEAHVMRTMGQQVLTLGKVMIVRLKPGGVVDWHVDRGTYAEKHDRFHLCLAPCWGAWLYSGGEGMVIGAGNLTYFDNHVLHSAANFGEVPRINLIVDVRRPKLQ